jgi:hypothetical protein
MFRKPHIEGKMLCGPHFLEEGSQGPHMLYNMTKFILFGFINYIFANTA